MDDGRGASALKDASRSARILNVMSNDDAKKYGLEKERRRYFRSFDDGKGEHGATIGACRSNTISRSVDIGNQTNERPSDEIAVVTRWMPPNPFDGVTSRHLNEIMKLVDQGSFIARTARPRIGWAKLVAEVLGLDIEDRVAKERVKGLLKEWIKTGALVAVGQKDRHGELRDFIKAGQNIDPKASAPLKRCGAGEVHGEYGAAASPRTTPYIGVWGAVRRVAVENQRCGSVSISMQARPQIFSANPLRAETPFKRRRRSFHIAAA